MRAGILYAMVKVARPGHVKTRLCPPLSRLQAADLAAAFALDTLDSLAHLDAVEVRLAVADRIGVVETLVPERATAGGEPLTWAGSGDRGLEARARCHGFAIEEQGEGDLGDRMERLLVRGLASGFPTVLVGGDAPDLPRETILAAFDALGRVDVVMVPARDGGYVLVGARRPVSALFRIAAPWGSDGVFTATCAALTRSGCAFEALAPWEDVDDAAALGRLATRLKGSRAWVAPATARLLSLWREQGVRF